MLKNVSKSLLDATRKVVEQSEKAFLEQQQQRIAKLTEKAMKPASSGSAPRNDQERRLAAMTHPKDKITHGDVLHGRGVKKEEVEQVEEAGKVVPGSPFSKDYKPQGDKPGEKAGFTSKKISTGTVYSRKPAKDMKENTDTPGNGYEHQCAIHVKSEQFGEGKTILSQHADPDAEGNIAWYDVMFEHGIEKQVPTDKLEILVSESHMNHKKKKK